MYIIYILLLYLFLFIFIRKTIISNRQIDRRAVCLSMGYKSIHLNEVKMRYFYAPFFFSNHSFHFSGNYDLLPVLPFCLSGYKVFPVSLLMVYRNKRTFLPAIAFYKLYPFCVYPGCVCAPLPAHQPDAA